MSILVSAVLLIAAAAKIEMLSDKSLQGQVGLLSKFPSRLRHHARSLTAMSVVGDVCVAVGLVLFPDAGAIAAVGLLALYSAWLLAAAPHKGCACFGVYDLLGKSRASQLVRNTVLIALIVIPRSLGFGVALTRPEADIAISIAIAVLGFFGLRRQRIAKDARIPEVSL